MSHHHVEIRQLCVEGASDAFRPFMNVYEEWGALGVWGVTHGVPVYLLQSVEGSNYCLMTFTNQARADEWLEVHAKNWKIAQKLGVPPLGGDAP